MPDPKPHHALSDDDLLSRATPIDPADLEDDPPTVDADAADELQPIDFDNPDEPDPSQASATPRPSKIRTFGPTAEETATDAHWKRQPTVSGSGATHVKTFFAKLRSDAIHHLDDQINQWLDAHPNYEVKFVNTTHGPLVGKTNEEAMFISVWV